MAQRHIDGAPRSGRKRDTKQFGRHGIAAVGFGFVVSGHHRLDRIDGAFAPTEIFQIVCGCVRFDEVFDDGDRSRHRVAPGVEIQQELFIDRESGATIVSWRPRRAPGVDAEAGAGVGGETGAGEALVLHLRPFLAARDYHGLQHENGAWRFDAGVQGERVTFTPYDGVPAISCFGNGRYRYAPDWYRRFLYVDEQARGLDARELAVAHPVHPQAHDPHHHADLQRSAEIAVLPVLHDAEFRRDLRCHAGRIGHEMREGDGFLDVRLHLGIELADRLRTLDLRVREFELHVIVVVLDEARIVVVEELDVLQVLLARQSAAAGHGLRRCGGEYHRRGPGRQGGKAACTAQQQRATIPVVAAHLPPPWRGACQGGGM